MAADSSTAAATAPDRIGQRLLDKCRNAGVGQSYAHGLVLRGGAGHDRIIEVVAQEFTHVGHDREPIESTVDVAAWIGGDHQFDPVKGA